MIDSSQARHSEWLVRWVIELREYRLIYQPLTSIKGKALADFIAKYYFKNNVHIKPMLIAEQLIPLESIQLIPP
jgi:hypothetical protein